MAGKAASAATGALSGAAAGSALGPWGAVGGAVLGGVGGYLAGDDGGDAPTYTPDKRNFVYGLGPSDSYASLQSERYDRRQQELAALGADAYNRAAPTQAMPDRIDFVGSDGQSYLQNAGAQARAQQLQALGGYQNANSAIQQFANAPQGPSAAQAQLRAGTDAAMRQQYGMARTQPGGGGAALRNAAFNATSLQGNAANSAAMLRAQEDQAFRQRQLQALGAVQSGAAGYAGQVGALRGQDVGLAQMQAGQSNFNAQQQNAFNQGQQQMQFQVGANNLQAAGQARGQNDAMALGASAQSAGYDAMRNGLAANNYAAGRDYEAARAQGAGVGVQSTQVNNQQSNTELATMLGAGSAAAGAYAQMSKKAETAPTSDVRAKTDIRPASVASALGGGSRLPPHVLEALEGSRARNAASTQVATDLGEFGGLPSRVGLGGAGDARQERMRQLLALGANERYSRAQEGQRPSTWGTGDLLPDLRGAQGYEYAYRDPERHGEGRYVGPMAQDLEHLPGVVDEAPDGTKRIDAPRLTLANTAAVSEQQRRLDEIERRQRELQALGAYPVPAAPNVGALDQAYQRGGRP